MLFGFLNSARAVVTFSLANTLCTDPVGQVYISDQGVYRGVFESREGFVKELLGSDVFSTLVERGLLVNMRPSTLSLPGYHLVVESDVMPFDIPCHYFDRRTLLKCVMVWLETNAILLQNNYSLGDCHFGNFMLCGNNQVKLIDLGSIHRKPVSKNSVGFPLLDLFFKEMLSPVLVIYQCREYARLARLVIEDAPINGPLNAQGDAVVDLSGLIADEIVVLKDKVSRCNEIESIQVLIDYLTVLIESPVDGENAVARLPGIERYGACGKSVLCVGSDLFDSVNRDCSDADITVLDWDADQLDRIGREIDSGGFDSSNRVALLFAHPLNRKFIDQGVSASLVVSHQPFEKFRHHSLVMNENIAWVLSSLTHERLIVSIGAEERSLVTFLAAHFFNTQLLSVAGGVAWYVCEKESIQEGKLS